jgi:hypothetical protein
MNGDSLVGTIMCIAPVSDVLVARLFSTPARTQMAWPWLQNSINLVIGKWRQQPAMIELMCAPFPGPSVRKD